MDKATQAAHQIKGLSPQELFKALRLAAWDIEVLGASPTNSAAEQRATASTARELEKAADKIAELWQAF
jgi:hypothetical protein